MNITDEIFSLFEQRGGAAYFGESVSQLEHALQTAQRAERDGATDALIAAALLHDIGHLLGDLSEDIAEQGVDGWHEEVGAAWLERYFIEAVTEPIRLHVAAKRYLCGVDQDYEAGLSQASRQSLNLQGGPMSQDEIIEFESAPYAQEAVRLRRWDEAAKIAGAQTPSIQRYRPLLERSLL